MLEYRVNNSSKKEYSRPSLIRTRLIRTLANPNGDKLINIHISTLLVCIITYTILEYKLSHFQ